MDLEAPLKPEVIRPPITLTAVTGAVLLAAAIAAAAGMATAAQEPPRIERVAWLQGCWAMTSPERTVEEQWTSPRGGMMMGVGRTVQGGRVVDYEFVIVREEGGRLAYEAHPSAQPSAVFLSGELNDSVVIFENPVHDFPQRIGYRRNGPDSLAAWVEGARDGRVRRIDFAYHRC